jgi:hypothetical protein
VPVTLSTQFIPNRRIFRADRLARPDFAFDLIACDRERTARPLGVLPYRTPAFKSFGGFLDLFLNGHAAKRAASLDFSTVFPVHRFITA